VPLASLFYFAVPSVFPARVAEFLGLQPVRMFLLILGRRVIPVLAVAAL
jgi:hypothetical protein